MSNVNWIQFELTVNDFFIVFINVCSIRYSVSFDVWMFCLLRYVVLDDIRNSYNEVNKYVCTYMCIVHDEFKIHIHFNASVSGQHFRKAKQQSNKIALNELTVKNWCTAITIVDAMFGFYSINNINSISMYMNFSNGICPNGRAGKLFKTTLYQANSSCDHDVWYEIPLFFIVEFSKYFLSSHIKSLLL